MKPTALEKTGIALLAELHENGSLNASKVSLLGNMLGWDENKGVFDLTRTGALQGDTYWEILFEFLTVMDYRDMVYPQPDRGELETYRMGALPLFAEKRRWKSHFLEKKEPVLLVTLMLQALWFRVHDRNLNALTACSAIYTQWTRRKLDVSNSIAQLQEEMGKTFFGEAWWQLYCDNEDAIVSLYDIVRKERPPVINRLLPRQRRQQQVNLPSDSDFTQSH